ncbi:hypothetical protein F0M18_13610 [Pseudohalioglobus sediminis]|uniref:MotA/TolQ/ExbB proton channel domain-containing protein n=1 Tax=Pseudohalioglobus sediminis TaxID=2606449 RepID=A0A5B0WUJ4_9GAMM|nr:hypothetical protein [Pseudohalioglobus sediminis]KAA1190097.1 hypothetical protein F0M18_13610 [Pseudohalioglobus sediminis]
MVAQLCLEKVTPEIRQWLNLLGDSVPVFLAVLVMFATCTVLLTYELRQRAPDIAKTIRYLALLDHSADLAFGVGVIFTAIGLQGALSGSGNMISTSSSMLPSLSLALTTTIAGGLLGYAMRTIVELTFGEKVARLEVEHASQ